MSFTPRRCQWITHRNVAQYESDLVDTDWAIIPHDAYIEQPGDWRTAVRKRMKKIFAYHRLAHGPHPEDCREGSIEWVEAMAVRSWGAETNEIAWISASGRHLYWYNEAKIDPLNMAACLYVWMFSAFPYIDGVMFDYLSSQRVTWQRDVIERFRQFSPARLEVITNGRPLPSSGCGRFLESMGRHWWSSLPKVINDEALPWGESIILDTFRFPLLAETAETIQILRPEESIAICYGRRREEGEVPV